MWIRWIATLALCSVTTACHLANNAARNLTYEVELSSGEIHERRKYEKLSNLSWEMAQAADPAHEFSKDFALGYKDGFVDFLQFGGTGQAPYTPPKRYWGPHYRTPDGHRAIEDWFAGFRLGATTARQSGYRQWVTLPSAQPTEPVPTALPPEMLLPIGLGKPIPRENQVAKNSPSPRFSIDALPPNGMRSSAEPFRMMPPIVTKGVAYPEEIVVSTSEFELRNGTATQGFVDPKDRRLVRILLPADETPRALALPGWLASFGSLEDSEP